MKFERSQKLAENAKYWANRQLALLNIVATFAFNVSTIPSLSETNLCWWVGHKLLKLHI